MSEDLFFLLFLNMDESLFSSLHGGAQTNLHPHSPPLPFPSCRGNNASQPQGGLLTLFRCNKLLLSQYDDGLKSFQSGRIEILPCVWVRVCANMHRRQCVTGEGLT